MASTKTGGKSTVRDSNPARRRTGDKDTEPGGQQTGDPMALAPNLALVHRRPGHLIRRAQQISVSVFMDECRDLEVTPVQYAALAIVEAYPGIDQAALAGLVAIDRSTAGNVVTRLSDKGWARRETDPRDKRFKRVYPTDDGVALLRRVQPRLDDIQARLLAPLSKTERAQFIALLAKVVDLNNDISRAPLQTRGLERQSSLGKDEAGD